MELDAESCYRALVSHDARFDGKFFVGVSSTGIYCRTVCPAKTPKPENCTFYPSAASAERAGYRPCLRCRPELAPGNAPIDASGRLAALAVSRIEDGYVNEKGVVGLAADLGITDRHLRRVVQEAFGVSPIELAQTQRLLLAKRLLTDTDLSITDVALASGWGSLRRFNTLFRERYSLQPTQVRASRRGKLPQESLICEVAYRPPLDWDVLLTFFAARALCGVESVEAGQYRRTGQIKGRQGWIAVCPAKSKNALRVEVSASLAPVLSQALARVKRIFDLDADPERIAGPLGPLAKKNPGLRLPGAWDGFEMAVRAILGQQISVRAATTLAGRVADTLGTPIETPFPTLTRLFPTPEQVANTSPEALIALKIISARAKTVLVLARAVVEGTLDLRPGVDPEATKARLQELPGVGEWTAEYVALRALSWPDAFPHSDLGIRKALGGLSAREVLERAEAWRPWRGYAALHLWKSLEEVVL